MPSAGVALGLSYFSFDACQRAVYTTAVLEKIISGGQTGSDRAALDFAIEQGIPHGGWCPAGRKAEDGPIASRCSGKRRDVLHVVGSRASKEPEVATFVRKALEKVRAAEARDNPMRVVDGFSIRATTSYRGGTLWQPGITCHVKL